MACRGSALNLGFDWGRCAHPGSSGGRLNSNLPGSVWLLGVEPGAGLDARRRVRYPAAAVLGLTQPREVGMFVLFSDVRQNP